MRNLRRACMALWLGASTIACGSDGGKVPSGDPLSPAQAETVCTDTCAHFVSCGWATDMAACLGDCTQQSGIFRGDGFTAWSACLEAADCSAGLPGEACYVEVVADLDARDIHDEYVAQCTSAQSTCTGLPSGVCDLDQVIMFSDGYMGGSVLPCFDLACDQLATCLGEKVLDAF